MLDIYQKPHASLQDIDIWVILDLPRKNQCRILKVVLPQVRAYQPPYMLITLGDSGISIITGQATPISCMLYHPSGGFWHFCNSGSTMPRLILFPGCTPFTLLCFLIADTQHIFKDVKKKLYDMKLVDSLNFLYCNNIDDIKHFLQSCEKTRNFFFYGGIE